MSDQGNPDVKVDVNVDESTTEAPAPPVRLPDEDAPSGDDAPETEPAPSK